MSSVSTSYWDGDWRARLADSVRAAGASSVSEFLARHPCEPYVKVVQRLSEPFVAAQLEMVQFEEAERSGQLVQAARDGLSRIIAYHLKRGWGRGMHAQFNTASAYAGWLGLLGFLQETRPELRAVGQAVWQSLIQQPPPEGWIPSGPNDLHIVSAVTAAWPG